jgi:hypothetical protein
MYSLNHQTLGSRSVYQEVESCSDACDDQAYPLRLDSEERDRTVRRRSQRDQKEAQRLRLKIYREDAFLQSSESRSGKSLKRDFCHDEGLVEFGSEQG